MTTGLPPAVVIKGWPVVDYSFQNNWLFGEQVIVLEVFQ